MESEGGGAQFVGSTYNGRRMRKEREEWVTEVNTKLVQWMLCSSVGQSLSAPSG